MDQICVLETGSGSLLEKLGGLSAFGFSERGTQKRDLLSDHRERRRVPADEVCDIRRRLVIKSLKSNQRGPELNLEASEHYAPLSLKTSCHHNRLKHG